MRKIFVAISVFVVLLGAVGFWYWQKNNFSKDALRFEILAPKEAAMGQEITYTVQWKNNGQVLLQNPALTFEFPQGAVPSEGTNTRVTKTVDDIYPGQEKSMDFKARLFGAQGDIQEAKAYLSYNPKNLQAQYESDTTTNTTITSVPINFDLDLPSRMESGQAFTFTVNYFSNSDYPLSNMRVKIDYPGGFTFQNATPQPIGQNEWSLGLFNKGQGGRLQITGMLQGQLQEVKNFHATFGSWNNGEFTLFKDVTRGVEMAQSQIQITQLINGDTPGGITLGDLLHYEISFKNVSDKDLANLFLVVSLDKNIFNLGSINVQNATVNAQDGSLRWDAKDNSDLQLLAQGDEGKAEFWIKTNPSVDTTGAEAKNFMLKDTVVLSDITQEFDQKINSTLTITQAGYYQDEVFGNEGPIPPQAGQKTTYTVIWKAQNLYNDVKNAKVKAILSSNVELTGKIFPDNSSLTFDSQSREIVWTIGDMQAETGGILPPSSVAFQVALTPGAYQRGSLAQLVGQAKITADDTFTVQTIFGTDSAIDTSISHDPTLAGKGIVQ